MRSSKIPVSLRLFRAGECRWAKKRYVKLSKYTQEHLFNEENVYLHKAQCTAEDKHPKLNFFMRNQYVIA